MFLYQPKLARINIILENGIQIFVQYNNHNEYSYSIIISELDLDRCRFDNHDDRWDVNTRPNHFHPRMDKIGYSSPMVGDPELDLPLLYSSLIKGNLLHLEFRF
jgi:hypothetical protein